MIVFNDHIFSGNCYPLKVGSSSTAKAYAENEKDPYKKLKKKKMSIENVFLYHFWLKRFIFAFLMFYYFMVSLKLLSAEFSPSKRIFFHPFISASADIGFGIFYFQYQILFLMCFLLILESFLESSSRSVCFFFLNSSVWYVYMSLRFQVYTWNSS